MIWLVMPHLLVIFNDICAYLFGIFLGKTPLIKLSPKKTWEGFLGGIVGSFLISMVVMKFMTFKYLTCPEYRLRLLPFVFDNDCPLDPLFTDYVNFNVFGLFSF